MWYINRYEIFNSSFCLGGYFLSPLSVFAGGPPSGLFGKLFPRVNPTIKKLPSYQGVRPVAPTAALVRPVTADDLRVQLALLDNKATALERDANTYARNIRDQISIHKDASAVLVDGQVRIVIDSKALTEAEVKAGIQDIQSYIGEDPLNAAGLNIHYKSVMRDAGKALEAERALAMNLRQQGVILNQQKALIAGQAPVFVPKAGPDLHKDDYNDYIFGYTVAMQRAIKNSEAPAAVIRGQLSGLQKRADELKNIKFGRALTAQEDEELLALESFIVAMSPR